MAKNKTQYVAKTVKKFLSNGTKIEKTFYKHTHLIHEKRTYKNKKWEARSYNLDGTLNSYQKGTENNLESEIKYYPNGLVRWQTTHFSNGISIEKGYNKDGSESCEDTFFPNGSSKCIQIYSKQKKKISYFDENDTERIRIIYHETPFFTYKIRYTYTPNGTQISKQSYLKKGTNQSDRKESIERPSIQPNSKNNDR